MKIEQVGRYLYSHTDALIGLALVFEEETRQTITINLISAPNHEMPYESILVDTELGPNWMGLIMNFI